MPRVPVPREVDELLARPNPAVVGTVRPDGSPHLLGRLAALVHLVPERIGDAGPRQLGASGDQLFTKRHDQRGKHLIRGARKIVRHNRTLQPGHPNPDTARNSERQPQLGPGSISET